MEMNNNIDRSSIRSQNINLHQTLQQMRQNFPPLPLHLRQLEQLYSNYINWNKIIDDSSKLYQMLIHQNQLAVLDFFGFIVKNILNDLDPILKSQQTNIYLIQLIQIINKNQPKFQSNEEQSNIQELIKKLLLEQKLQITGPFNQQRIQFRSKQQKNNFVFSLLFQHLHNMILLFKLFYSLQDVTLLESTIFQCFAQYGQNAQIFQQQKNKQLQTNKQRQSIRSWFKSKIFGSKQTEIQVKQQKQVKKQQNALSEPKIVDELINIVIKQAEDQNMIQKVNSEQEKNNKNSMKINNYEIKPINIIEKGSSLLPILTTKGIAKIIANKINGRRDKSTASQKYEISEQEQQKVMKLAQTILKSHIRHNVNRQEGLSPQEFNKVEEFIKNGRKQHDLDIIQGIFTQNQKQILIETLQSAINTLKSQKSSYTLQQKLKKFTDIFLSLQVKQLKKSSKISIKRGISTTLSKLKSNHGDLPNVFYFLVVLYEYLKENYCPQTRRTLLKICHQIELQYNSFANQNEETKKFCLVHSLKLLQSQDINRSKVCSIITNQKPFRESQLPLVHQKQQYFEEDNKQKIYTCDEAQKYLEHLINELHIFQLNKPCKQPPKMQLLKLSHSKNKKNVTILISGFLSEDTNKFQEWMGMIEPTYDSEIYALKWESKTVENMLQYVIDTCKDLAFTGAGVGLFGGPYIKAALILREIITKYHSNPFMPCFEVANITGLYFAQVLISLFEGHFINLVGFSLGTQVISSTLERLKVRNKLHMINRVVTLGGVADKNKLTDMFQSTQQNNDNPISISWTNVYCQTDNILRYLLKISMPNIVPVGLNEIKSLSQEKKNQKNEKQKMQLEGQAQRMEIEEERKQKTYNVDNMNVTQFIDGHLTYRCNMKNIARLLGMKDQ